MRLASSVANATTVLPQLPIPSSSGVTPKILTTGDGSILTSKALDKKANTGPKTQIVWGNSKTYVIM